MLTVRLGGDWNSKQADRPVGAWRQAIAQMRNKVLHLAYRPSHSDARAALEALSLLERHVLDRLANRAHLYPITALSMEGYEGLQRRGAEGKVRATMDNQNIAAMKLEFQSWLKLSLSRTS